LALLGAVKSGPTTERRIAKVKEEPKNIAIRGKVTKKEARKAEAESQDRTIAECITSRGGKYGQEMARAKDERQARAARRKQKAAEKA